MPKTRLLLLSLALLSLNALISWPLFWIEYLDDLHSNEGSFIIFGKFLRDYWPHCLWFPWFNAGSLVAHCSPAHACSLAPHFVFLFAHKESQHLAPSGATLPSWSMRGK
jgi:hypothetical protein